ncbi:S41 family peptidase [Xanthomarina gelatinilytica]|uniref:S41 family peptidase n=1 Tax=Xanthomarina gelatinilytica TaxID=1137281 RepID=UPI003AA8D6EB
MELIPKKNLNYDRDYVEKIVTTIANTYHDNYVFPEKGQAIKKSLLKNLKDGKYNIAKNYDSLSAILKRDMIAITNDKHINVSYNGNKIEEDAGGVGGNFFDQFKNYGFEKVEMLDGGIGYIDLTIFHPIQMKPESAEVAQESMQSLKDSKALIFDLRNCRGGDPAMLNLLVTYLYPEGEKKHLNDFFYRPSNDTTSTYTVDKVKGRRFVSEPVYILTSNRTFSAAEEFAYDLKHMGRATIVGEITGGGAHPVRSMNIENDFEVSVPVGRAINPITKTNWEGVGVIPDIKVKKEDALNKALEWINKQK